MKTRLPQDLNRPVQNQNKQPGVSKVWNFLYGQISNILEVS
jgi:hypothetical protein